MSSNVCIVCTLEIGIKITKFHNCLQWNGLLHTDINMQAYSIYVLKSWSMPTNYTLMVLFIFIGLYFSIKMIKCLVDYGVEYSTKRVDLDSLLNAIGLRRESSPWNKTRERQHRKQHF